MSEPLSLGSFSIKFCSFYSVKSIRYLIIQSDRLNDLFFFVLTAGESENTSLTIFLRASSFTLLGGVFTVSYLNGALSQCVYVLHPTYFYSLFCFSNPDKMAQQK